MTAFEKTGIDAEEPASRRGRPAPVEFETSREDWEDFRSLHTLPRKAGVQKCDLAKLVVKELADNALDEVEAVELTERDGWIEVSNPGEGMAGTDEEIAARFSIGRPMTSTKLWRKPTRGA